MRKLAKLSLVAAVAVAGLTNVNAASLEEAIKGVDVSGQFRFRFQEQKIDNGADKETNSDVEIEVGVKVPVTDNVTAVFKIDNVGNKKDNFPSGDVTNDPATNKVSINNGDLRVEDYYFSYNQDALTVNAGQQNIPGRMTDGAQGDGLVALYNLGNATVGAAAFANHNVDVALVGLDGSQSLLSVIAMGNVGPVSLLGQYATVEDTVDSFNLKADASIAMAKVGLEYTESELDSAITVDNDDRSTLKAYVSAKVGIVSAKATYAKTGDNGSGAIDSQANTDGLETPSEFLLWNLGTTNKADMDVYAIDASVAVTNQISLRAAYAAGEIDDGTSAGNDVEEILGQISYKVSKNLNTYVRYAQFDNSSTSDEDGQRGRVEVRYSF